ncbi:metalloprotease [Pigeonpox virus]|uniref:Metalloendopeptidase n=1 Tax=Pigeonpox virus TaxID=10264 RepID=A0A068EG47_9POXV|nr:metalloprotease [Pigeonpox virus]AID46590.1 metalloprotease [Pigeonpox virus]
MIQLNNGIRIFVNHSMKKDIYIGISDFGFEKDINDDILGIAHLLEHILISFDNKYFNANASTSRTYMSFWCVALQKRHYEDAIRTAISWFFDKKGMLKTDFSRVVLENYITELENEYYYRTEMYHCMDVLAYLYGGDLYNGGRITMLERLPEIRNMLSNRMKFLSGKNIVIFIKKLTNNILKLLTNTFGTIPKYPIIIPLDPQIQDARKKIIMMPCPFYTLLIQVDNTINNLLAIICLVENYNLIDYETISDKLYVCISFANEYQYEYLLYNIKDMDFNINRIELDLGEDYIMNLYINFPWLKNDIFEYIHTMNTKSTMLLDDLKKNMHNSILDHKFMIIYPSFTKLLYNITDKQNHGILVVGDVNFTPETDPNIHHSNKENNNKYSKAGIKSKSKYVLYRKTPTTNNIVIDYTDNSFFDYATFYHVMKSKYEKINLFSRLKTSKGMCYKHCFDNDDLNELINSDTFIRYNSSKPAVLYQYILLAYFVTERDIKELVDHKDAIELDMKYYSKNKILFGKNTRYDIRTKSMFVCGLIKGRKLSEKVITDDYMWKLKSLGLIYYLTCIKLEISNTFYIFAFTIFPEKVYKFFVGLKEITNRCLIVSNKNTKTGEDDYSSLNKQIVIDIK